MDASPKPLFKNQHSFCALTTAWCWDDPFILHQTSQLFVLNYAQGFAVCSQLVQERFDRSDEGEVAVGSVAAQSQRTKAGEKKDLKWGSLVPVAIPANLYLAAPEGLSLLSL